VRPVVVLNVFGNILIVVFQELVIIIVFIAEERVKNGN